MEIVQLDGTQLALLGTIIAGATEFIKRLRAKDLWVAATIASAAILGGLIVLSWGLDFISGVAAGLSTSGFISILSAFGNKSTPTESKIVKE